MVQFKPFIAIITKYLIVLLISNSAVHAQYFANSINNNMSTTIDDEKPLSQIPEYKIKAALILNIASNIEWPNERNIKEFGILIVDSDTLIYNEVKSVESIYKLKGKPIKVSLSSPPIRKPTEYSIIYLSHSHSPLVNSIYQQIGGKGVLIVTDEGTERLLTMVNLFLNKERQSVSFEINRHTLEENGFTLSPKLVALGGSFIDIKELYLKTYHQLIEENKKLLQLQADLTRYQQEKAEYESEIRTLNEKVNRLNQNTEVLEKQYNNASVSLKQKDSLLLIATKELAEKVAESQKLQTAINKQVALINSSRNQLDLLNKQIVQTQKILDQKQKEIEEQDVIITEKESVILKQQRRFFIMLIALVGISFTLVFAFWAYSIKRRLNIKLEKQVEIRTQELNLSREHYQRLFEHSPVAMLELDLSLLLNYVNSIGIPLDSMDQVDRGFSNDRVREGIKFIKVVNVNKAALKLLGFENKSDAVENYAKTYSKESLETFRGIYKALIERWQFSEYQSIRNTKDGKKLFVVLKWIVLPGYSHDYSRVLLSITDITKLKEYENELKQHRDHLEEIVEERTQQIIQLNKMLQESNEELLIKTEELEQTIRMLEDAQKQLVHQEKMASLGMLTAGIAHEINNPINFISGGQQAIESLLDELWNSLNIYRENALKYSPPNITYELETNNSIQVEELYSSMKLMLRNIETGIERTTGIIKSLKAFVRPDSKELVEVSVPETVTDVLNMLRGNYKDRIEIVQHYTENLPKVKCYPNQLHQVLMNLITNAIDAIPGKGKIYISGHYSNSTNNVTIRLKDTGTGIPSDIQEKIFDPFFTTKEAGKGTGLGLYITYNIIQSLNGNITVNSMPNEGAEFTITLPAEK